MKIEKVEPFILTYELDDSFYFSQWEYKTRTVCLVKVTTDDGVYGWGEGYGPANLIKAGIEFFTPYLLNQDPQHHERLWRTMFLRSFDFARRGVLLSALSAIDVALWDLKGKLWNQPVSILIGGRKREIVKAYATGMYFSDGVDLAKKLAKEAASYKKDGFNAMKMKVGLSVKKDIENVKAVREAIGPDIQLMIDANHAYSLKEAVQLALAIEQYDIAWFEEPLSPENYDCYAELRTKTIIPIAGGECEYLSAGFLNLFQKRSVDIAQPDICAAGGITEVKKIAALAELFGVEMVLHTWGSGIGIAAALQVLANLDVIPGRLHEPELLLELDRTVNPLRDGLIIPQYKLEDGTIRIPNSPGLGVDIDEKIFNKHLLEK